MVRGICEGSGGFLKVRFQGARGLGIYQVSEPRGVKSPECLERQPAAIPTTNRIAPAHHQRNPRLQQSFMLRPLGPIVSN